MKTSHLFIGHYGGVKEVVSDKTHEQYGDYEKVAHIDPSFENGIKTFERFTKQDPETKAYIYGRAAFHRGLPQASALDANMMQMIHEKEGDPNDTLRAWARGWNICNMVDIAEAV